jgi:hypothetical protein
MAAKVAFFDKLKQRFLKGCLLTDPNFCSQSRCKKFVESQNGTYYFNFILYYIIYIFYNLNKLL